MNGGCNLCSNLKNHTIMATATLGNREKKTLHWKGVAGGGGEDPEKRPKWTISPLGFILIIAGSMIVYHLASSDVVHQAFMNMLAGAKLIRH